MNDKIIIDKGLYNNIDIIENTAESFNEAFKSDYIVKTKVQVLKDNTFVLLEDDAIERLLKLKDNIKNIIFDEIEYISKYDILKIDEFLNILKSNQTILEIPNFSRKTLNLFLKKIENYQKNIIILSMSVKVLKFFRKNGFQVMLKIARKNKMLINAYFKPDFYLIDNGLMDRKKIKKLREDFYVVANGVKKDEIKYALDIYNNVIISD